VYHNVVLYSLIERDELLMIPCSLKNDEYLLFWLMSTVTLLLVICSPVTALFPS
jgi:hypothetical protein